MRRYKALRGSSAGKSGIDGRLRLAVLARDGGCVGFGRLPGDCAGALQLDHVRASHAMGMKSPTEPGNLVALCGAHHLYKTENGRAARPLLLAYLAAVTEGTDDGEGR